MIGSLSRFDEARLFDVVGKRCALSLRLKVFFKTTRALRDETLAFGIEDTL
jgi:hypothetical protein